MNIAQGCFAIVVKKKEHVVWNCGFLKRMETRPGNVNVCTVKIRSNSLDQKIDSQSEMITKTTDLDIYRPFISAGYILLGANAEMKPIKVLRDTGASRLLLHGESYTVTSILSREVELGFVRTPLHIIHPKLD